LWSVWARDNHRSLPTQLVENVSFTVLVVWRNPSITVGVVLDRCDFWNIVLSFEVDRPVKTFVTPHLDDGNYTTIIPTFDDLT